HSSAPVAVHGEGPGAGGDVDHVTVVVTCPAPVVVETWKSIEGAWACAVGARTATSSAKSAKSAKRIIARRSLYVCGNKQPRQTNEGRGRHERDHPGVTLPDLPAPPPSQTALHERGIDAQRAVDAQLPDVADVRELLEVRPIP